MKNLNYDREHKRRLIAKARAREGAPGWKLPALWERRAARLRRSASGVLLRIPRS